MRQSILLFLLLPSFAVIAQPQFVSPGAEWWYSFSGGFAFTEGWSHIYYEKDTVVSGLACKKLINESFFRDSPNDTVPFQKAFYYKFVRQQGDSVFVFVDPAWLLRWRTNPTVGTTFLTQKESWTTDYKVLVKVDSIKPVNINGQAMNKIYQSGKVMVGNVVIGGDKVAIYSHIGPEYGSFNYMMCWDAFDCYNDHLCRFKNNAIPLYEFNSFNCDVISSTQSPDFAGNLVGSPNPCTDHISFDFTKLNYTGDLKISIVDKSGRILHTCLASTGQIAIVQTAGLPSGMYYYFIGSDNGQYAGRFLKE